MEEKDDKEFTVHDRRTASPGETSPAQEERPKQHADAEQKPADTAKPQGQKDTAPLPELDFSTFVLTLATTAQMHLGDMQNPQSGKPEQNLPSAKHMIDILGILKGKTKGNLNKDEEMLLESALYNLRMQYVRAAEGKK